LQAPDGKPFIVHVVVNLEVWPFDKQMPRAILQHPHNKIPMPDIGNFSWVEYGLRCGVPRLAKLFADRGIPVSNFMNAAFPEYYPTCAELAMKVGWRLTGHGLFQRSLLYEDNETAVIEEALERYQAFCGHRPRGWLGAGYGESLETPDILKRLGFEFLHDWMVDDVPAWMKTKHGPLLALPYALELNDVMVFALERHSTPEYLKRFSDTIEWFVTNEPGEPKILTLGLHPHIIAPAYRISALASVIDMLLARNDVVFMTGDQMMDWFVAQQPSAAIQEPA
jgi:hypothetical protein